MYTLPTMLTIKQCVEETGLSYDRIRKLCLENRIVYIRSGNKYFVNKEKLAAYLNGEEDTA